MIRALLLALAASPAAADPALLDFMGGQGCTIGADSRVAALAAGFDAAAIDALVAETLADGRASQQGAYVVLNAATCTIRLPDITSAYTVASPEIVAITSAVDAHAADGSPGCFLSDVFTAFESFPGIEGDGYSEAFAFLAASIISGEVRLFSPSPLVTPFGFQVVAGACANVPEIDAIRTNHAFIAQGFGAFVRESGARTSCRDGTGPEDLQIAATLQGVDWTGAQEAPPGYNAVLWMEYYMIAWAAGWREGLAPTETGTLRPPLCHYPAEG